MSVAVNLAVSINSVFGALQAKSGLSRSSSASTAGAVPSTVASSTSSAPVSAWASSASGGASSAASAGASVDVAEIASADAGVGASPGSAAATVARSAAKSAAAANDPDIERHFAIGMQETTAQFAFDRLSQEGAGPSGAAASLDTSEKRLQALVSQIAVARAPAGQAASDGHDTSSTTAAAGGPAPSATPDQVQKAYADA